MSSAIRLEDILGNHAESCLLPTEVAAKGIEPEIDLGNLLVVDSNPIEDITDEAELKTLARDCTQLLVNKLWQCEKIVTEDNVTAKLPPPSTVIPREKPVPKPRPPTKWEEFAKKKGIQKTKKATKVWDEESKCWKFSWGYKKKLGEKERQDYHLNTALDMAEDDPNVQRNKKWLTKKERVAKNELNRLKNIARQKRSNTASLGVLPTPSLDNKYIPVKAESKNALKIATKSTASLGTFTEPLRSEKGKSKKFSGGKTRLHPDSKKSASDKDSFLKIFDNIQSKRDKIDGDTAVKAVNKENSSKKEDKKLSKSTIKKKTQGRKHSNKVSFDQLKKGRKSTGVSSGRVSKKPKKVPGKK